MASEDLIAWKWVESLSEEQQSVLISGSIKRLQSIIVTALTTARAEGEAAERKVWMQWADGLTGHKLYLASAMRRAIKTIVEAAAGSREDEQKNLG